VIAADTAASARFRVGAPSGRQGSAASRARAATPGDVMVLITAPQGYRGDYRFIDPTSTHQLRSRRPHIGRCHARTARTDGRYAPQSPAAERALHRSRRPPQAVPVYDKARVAAGSPRDERAPACRSDQSL